MQHTKTCPMMQLLIANVFGLETFRQRSLAKFSNNVRSVPQSHWISNAKLCPSTAWFVVSINRMLQVSPRPSGRGWRRRSPKSYPATTTSRMYFFQLPRRTVIDWSWICISWYTVEWAKIPIEDVWNAQFGNDWVSVLREGMSWYNRTCHDWRDPRHWLIWKGL